MFRSARIKLTFWYLLIIMLVSFFFSIAIYKELTNEVDRFAQVQRFRLERRLSDNGYTIPVPGNSDEPRPITAVDSQLVLETKHRILLMLIFTDAGIAILAGGFAYFLAGRTLLPIKQMVEDQNRFVSDASHEFRTPLTALKSAMEVYLRDKKSTVSDAKKLISENLEDVNKLQSLSDRLLQLARYQNNGIKKSLSQISLKEVSLEAISKINPISKRKKIKIENRVGRYTIIGEKEKLVELFVILLDNAIKYSNPGKTISIDTKKTDGKILISFKDQGAGISAKDMPHIFDRFFRADSSRGRTDNGGYGLGLSIAKNIVSDHGGQISAKSKLGLGSTFVVTLNLV